MDDKFARALENILANVAHNKYETYLTIPMLTARFSIGRQIMLDR